MEGLIVRIINDKIHNGKLYNKKLQVKSILSETKFLIADPSNGSEVYSDILEKHLETVLPPSKEYSSATVVILEGEFKGEHGHILDKNKKTEKVTV